MYLPKAFKVVDAQRLHETVERHEFSTASTPVAAFNQERG
jgi:predicted FMN-binding regulatory protein PaiB